MTNTKFSVGYSSKFRNSTRYWSMGCPPLSSGSAHWTHIEKGLLVGTRLVTALGAREGGREGGGGRERVTKGG